MTLYGIVDAGIQYNSDVAVAQNIGAAGRPVNYASKGRLGFQSGADYGDRWGLKGVEDLGDGYTAIFQLENWFNIGNGALNVSSSTLWGRQGYMGLNSTRYGTLTFGRQYDVTNDLVEYYGPDSAGGIGTYPGDLSNFDGSIRINNSIKYRTPTIDHLTGEIVYGFGGVAGSAWRNSTLSVGANYVAGPVAVGAAYMRMDNSGATGNTWSSASADSNFGSSVTAGFAGARAVQTANAIAAYTFGTLMLGVNYGYTQYRPSALSSFHQVVAYNSAGIAMRYQYSTTMSFALSPTYTRGQSVGDGKARPWYASIAGVGFYNLSKRTSFYLYGGYQRAGGDTFDAFGNLVAATPSLGDAANGSSSGSRNQALIRIGMFNKF
ncbi:gram-negative porin family protein [Paraburkholderia xenovorans LB400]|uniref:porin n=1 Tax=Paraburkholderia xenovorans TaxID=36873 RepID=UPI00003C461C|nr:porin [Paraburkholderia xenovorans]AIP33964.1 gram-negative porin family protein [Paraburkholderia xenovorans LB400]